MTLRKVGVLDYGSGNLHSACRALAAAGAEVTLSSQRSDLIGQDALVVPGVGAFAACMDQLRAVGGDELVREWSAAERPLLGICVGHQVLFDEGLEHGVRSAGIGVLPGRVEQVVAQRLPHMGWNTLEFSGPAGVFEDLVDRRCYFVHSYAVHDAPPGAVVGWTTHGSDRFVGALQWRGVTSTQFHPEKSGAAGADLLRRWLMD